MQANQSKHTPGPWQIISTEGVYTRITAVPIIKKEWGTATICDLFYDSSNYSGHASYNNAEANGRLIAAAPDLLKVLMELQKLSVYWSEHDVPIGICGRINAAIEKATGPQK